MKFELKDQLNTLHSFAAIPKRIISLVPSQTELLFDLGLEDSIIGITKFCIHPYHLKPTKKIIGGTKKVHFEKIRLLQPDIIIANKEENTQEIVDELSKICPVWITDIYSIEDNFQMILDFGKLFNKRTEAQKWIDKIKFGVSDFQNFIKEKPSRKAAYFIWANPYMVTGNGTFINEMLQLNKFENCYGTKERYPEIELKNLVSDGNPELILLSSEPYPFKEKEAEEIKKFTTNAKIIMVDGEMFSWYGSRLSKAFAYFKKLHISLED